MNMGWPEWIWVALMFYNAAVFAINDGKPRSKYNFNLFVVSVPLSFGLLYWGGFFA